jgi:hypothetical protein
MFRVDNQNISVGLDVVFASPLAYDAGRIRTIAKSALEQFAALGLRPSNLYQNPGDQLFNYELSFPLFNNQAHFRLSGERLIVSIQNARTKVDVRTLIDVLVGSQKCFTEDAACHSNFQAVAHGMFSNEDDFNAFFAPFNDPANDIIDGGRILFIKEKDWPFKVRLSFERSTVFKNSAFITWWTEQSGMVGLEKFEEIADKFGKSLQKAGLEINFNQL